MSEDFDLDDLMSELGGDNDNGAEEEKPQAESKPKSPGKGKSKTQEKEKVTAKAPAETNTVLIDTPDYVSSTGRTYMDKAENTHVEINVVVPKGKIGELYAKVAELY